LLYRDLCVVRQAGGLLQGNKLLKTSFQRCFFGPAGRGLDFLLTFSLMEKVRHNLLLCKSNLDTQGYVY